MWASLGRIDGAFDRMHQCPLSEGPVLSVFEA